MKHILYFLSIILCLQLTTGCIEDGITTLPGNIPTFSVDTLSIGDVFSAQGTPTASFKVFNPYKKSLIISNITITDDNEGLLRMNVDGLAGNDFKDIEIRGGDSIFIFVEANYPDLDRSEPAIYTNHISFVTNGVSQSIPVKARVHDAVRLKGNIIDTDTRLSAGKPYIIYDSLMVVPGVTLTLDADVKLHFHDGACLIVDGTLISNGAPGKEVEMTGDRMGNVVGRVDYEIMSGQWDGVYFSNTSRNNSMRYTSIRNTVYGVILDSLYYTETEPSMDMLNCQLRNSKGYSLMASHSYVRAIGCELADASAGVIALHGGKAQFSNCTIANYYLFTALGGPAVQFSHITSRDADTDEISAPLLKATFDNSILYGNGTELSHTDLADTEVLFRRCLLKSNGSDDDHFLECLWDTDPQYATIREEYLFDYRLSPDSEAIGAADQTLIPSQYTCDRYGTPIDLTLGAYSTRPE